MMLNQSKIIRKRSVQRCMGNILIILGLAYVGWLLLLYCMQNSIMFPRAMIRPPLLAPPVEGMEVLSIDLPEGGTVDAWLIRPAGTTPPAGWPVVVFFHGNGELIDFQQDLVHAYGKMGFALLLVEYRGYGRSAGKPSQLAIRSDALEFYDRMIQRGDIDRDRVVFQGRSIGGAVAIDLATLRRPAALIIQSTFTRTAVFARRFGVPPWLVKNPYRNDQAVSRLDVPMLIFHGSQDEVIPISHGRQLNALASRATYVEYECGHNDFPGLGNDKVFWAQVEEFLNVHVRKDDAAAG